jgi:hypothetical protein
LVAETIMKAIGVIVGLVLAGTTARAYAIDAPVCVDSGLVMVNATFVHGPAQRGAGNVIKVEDGHVIVATAAHLIERDGERAADIQIQFRTRSRKFSAKIIHSMLDNNRDQDLATLDVPVDWRLDPESLCRLGELNDLHQGDTIYYVGHPAAPAPESWAVGHGEVTGFYTWRVRFSVAPDGAPSVEGGFSGGALYDSRWHIVAMVVSADHTRKQGHAVSFRAIGKTLASLPEPIRIDLHLENSRRAFLFDLGMAMSFGGDESVTQRFPALMSAVAIELTSHRIGTGRFVALSEFEATYAARNRRPKIAEYPGQPVMPQQVSETFIGVASLLRVQLQWHFAALLGELGGAYNRFSEFGDPQWRWAIVFGGGLSINVLQLGRARLSLLGRVRASAAGGRFEVTDFHFTLAGGPESMARLLDNPWFTALGIEVSL